jgi:hypothetical protein
VDVRLLYAEFVEKEVLPREEREANVTVTKDPDGRADAEHKDHRDSLFVFLCEFRGPA